VARYDSSFGLTGAFGKDAGVLESSVRSKALDDSGAVAPESPDSPIRSTKSMAFLFPLDEVVFATVECLSAID
jgi:hypothetical protein